jgi:hypothetical protein
VAGLEYVFWLAFQPALVDGKPVADSVVVPLGFYMRPSGPVIIRQER